MAHSKSGGTRSYIRGKVGSDVYSIGKNAKGKKQQVVRSLAETVANPQTIGQMKGRMIMSTIMQAVAAMRVIIDHSFDNVPSGQPCISEFIARNYALVKADVAANPSSGNQFGMVKYGEKGARVGAFLVSDGKAVLPACLAIAANGAKGEIALTSDTLTGAGLKAALGLSSDEYITLLGFDKDGAFVYARLHIASDLADDTVLSAANIASAFDIEGNVTPTFTLASNTFSIALNGANKGLGWIVSKKSDTGYKHNQCVIEGVSAPTYTANVAIQTYPVGGNAFLNGGEEEPSFNPTPSPSPEPEPEPEPAVTHLLTITSQADGQPTGITVDGVAFTSPGQVAEGALVKWTYDSSTYRQDGGTVNGVQDDNLSGSVGYTMGQEDTTIVLKYMDRD